MNLVGPDLKVTEPAYNALAQKALLKKLRLRPTNMISSYWLTRVTNVVYGPFKNLETLAINPADHLLPTIPRHFPKLRALLLPNLDISEAYIQCARRYSHLEELSLTTNFMPPWGPAVVDESMLLDIARACPNLKFFMISHYQGIDQLDGAFQGGN